MQKHTLFIIILFFSFYITCTYTLVHYVISSSISSSSHQPYKTETLTKNIEMQNNNNSAQLDLNQKSDNKSSLLKNKNMNKYTTKNQILKNNNKLNSATSYNDKQLVEWTGEIPLLSFKPIIAYPEFALDSKNPLCNVYDENHITPTEFINILNHLYTNDYVLINFSKTYKKNGNTAIKQNAYIPLNKKPIILCLEDVSYSHSNQNTGLIDKLILDNNNQIANYTTKRPIQDRITYDNDFIVILENFIDSHNDFSFENARALISFNGVDGIFGYRIQRKNATFKSEVKKVNKILTKLKNLGYEFASSGYQPLDMTSCSDIDFAKNINKWNTEIRDITGNTDVYIYSENKYEILKDGIISYKQKLLNENFSIFIIPGETASTEYYADTKIFTKNKIDVNGAFLKNKPYMYESMFDAKKIFDHLHRIKPYSS